MRIVRIVKQTAVKDGDKFDLSGCTGFSVNNKGTNDASYGYEGNPETFDIQQGDSQLYGFLSEGYEFGYTMEVKFKGQPKGKVDVILFKATTIES